MNRTLRIATLVVATSSVLVGCGAVAEKASEKAAEKAIESQTNGDVDINTDDGTVKIETEDGTATFGSGEVPEEWPEDLALPDDLKVQTGSTTDGSDGRIVAITGLTTESAEDLLERYKDSLSDWEISGDSTTTASGATLVGAQWDTDGRRVTFAATGGLGTGSDDQTTLIISHTTLD